MEAKSTDRPVGDRFALRAGAILGLTGLVVQAASSQLHPGHVQPNDSVGAFLEYAAFDAWVIVHIGQFAGTLLLGIGLVLLARSVSAAGLGGVLAVIGGLAALLLVGLFAVQMALDGVALRFAIDAWIGAPAEMKAHAFAIADTIRSLEKGLSGIFHLLNGTTLLAIGGAIASGVGYARWLGLIGMAAGILFLGGGVVTAETGFSEQAGQFLGPVLPLTIVFLVGIFVSMWRRAARAGSSSLAAIAQGETPAADRAAAGPDVHGPARLGPEGG